MDPLAEAFRDDLPCPPADAAALAAFARTWARTFAPESSEDDSADLVTRFRDPVVFGSFACARLRSRRLRAATRVALAQRAFDLLPLPSSERSAFDSRRRVPPTLIEIAAWMAGVGEATPLEFLHVLYAVFLDRDVVRRAPKGARSRVLRAVLAAPDLEGSSKVVYGLLHLGSVPSAEAAREFRWLGRTPVVPESVRKDLALAASSTEAARGTFFDAARDQMLLPDDATADDPTVAANAPTLPPALEPLARAVLARKT